MTEYFDIAMTPSVLALQERKGSRAASRRARGSAELSPHVLERTELEMMTSRDSFYLASVSETGWPYVQHRGGDIGFVKQLDDHTIGWIERSGNRQYVGTGNITATEKVAAIFVDYPSRTRLKLYGHATHHSDPSPELLAQLGAEAERIDGAITVEVIATDWNCPKFITPRFTHEQVSAMTASLQQRIDELETHNAELHRRLPAPPD